MKFWYGAVTWGLNSPTDWPVSVSNSMPEVPVP